MEYPSAAAYPWEVPVCQSVMGYPSAALVYLSVPAYLLVAPGYPSEQACPWAVPVCLSVMEYLSGLAYPWAVPAYPSEAASVFHN